MEITVSRNKVIILFIGIVIIASFAIYIFLENLTGCVFISGKCFVERCEVWKVGEEYISREQIIGLYTLHKVQYNFPDNASIMYFDLSSKSFNLEIYYKDRNETQQLVATEEDCSAWSLINVEEKE